MSIPGLNLSNPFPGLRPFAPDEDYLFFGREAQTTELLSLLRQHRFIAVVGTSGSGKSSLVRAGLLPALYGGTMAQAGSAWEMMLLRPGGDPIANLARAMLAADLYDAEDDESLPRLQATLARSSLGLVEAAKQSDLAAETNLLIVVDQFEELFRFRQTGVSGQESAAAFVKLLLSASTQQEQPIYVAITMRSDYLGDCSQIPGLAEAVNDGEYLIPRLSRAQRRAAIEKPVQVGGGTIAPRLVHKLLNDVGDDADQLPVLQHALMRIWDCWAAERTDGEPLDLRHYELVGGLHEALSRHADEVYAELANDQYRLVAEKLFQALTERGTDNRGIRRPTRLHQLCQIIGASTSEVTAVVDAFRQPGRTFLMPTQDVELAPETVVDISHESLMRVWRRLNAWVEDESQSARIYCRLADTAALHQEDKAGLYHDPDLQIALSWRETARPNEAWASRYHGGFESAMQFLDESKQAEEAERQAKEAARRRELEQAQALAETQRLRAEEQQRSAVRLRWFVRGLGLVAMVAITASVFALLQRYEATRSANIASLARDDANQARAVAEKNASLAEQLRAEAEQSAAAALASEKQAQEARIAAESLQDEFRLQVYQSDMNLVAEAYAAGNIDRVVELLTKHWADPGEKDLRGFEWYHWWQAAHLYQSQIFSGPPPWGGPFRHLAASPDRSTIALVVYPNGISVRSSNQDRELTSLRAPSEFSTISFSREGAFLVAANPWNGEILVYRTDDWTAQTLQAPQNGGTDSIAFSSTKPLMASGGSGERIVIWSTESWEPITHWDAGGEVRSLAFSPVGDLLLAGMDSSSVVVWDVDTGNFKQTLNEHTKQVSNILYSPDGTFLVTAGADNTVLLWSESLELVQSYDTPGPVNSLDFSPDGERLVAATAGSNRVLVWKVLQESPALELIHAIAGHSRQVTGAVFLDNGNRIMSVSEDGSSRFWDPSRCEPYVTLKPAPQVKRLAYVADERDTLLMLDQSGKVKRWDTRSHEPLSPLDDGADFASVSVSDDGTMVAGISQAGDVSVWEAGTGRLDLRQAPKAPPATQCAVSPDGPTVAWPSEEGVVLWNAASGDITKHPEIDTLTEFKAFSFHDNTLALIQPFDFSTGLWDTANDPARLVADLTGWGPEVCAEFSPVDSLIAIGSYNNNIRIHNAGTGELVHTLKGHTSAVRTVAFSSDGNSIVSGAEDRTVRIWNVKTGQMLSSLHGHATTVVSVDFSRSGDSVASLSEDGVVKIWTSANRAEVSPSAEHWIERAKYHADVESWDRAHKALSEAMKYDTNTLELITTSGQLYLRLGLWKEAGEQFVKRLEFVGDDSAHWMHAAAPLVLAGSLEEYRGLCRAMNERFSGPTMATQDAERLTKICLLAPGIVNPSELPIHKVADDLENGLALPWLQPWYYLARALHAYRAGDPEAASQFAVKVTANGAEETIAASRMILAMAQHELGQTKDAQRSVDEVGANIAEKFNRIRQRQLPASWENWMIAEILRREAEALIKGTPK